MAAFMGKDVQKLKAKGGGKWKYMSEVDMVCNIPSRALVPHSASLLDSRDTSREIEFLPSFAHL